MKTPTITPVFNRASRSNKSEKYPVHLRITLGQESRFIRIHTPMLVTPEQWAGKEGRWINENLPYAFEINDRIRETRYKIEEVVKRFYIHNKQIAFVDIMQHMRKKGDGTMFNDFVAEYIRLKPEKLEVTTWEKYVTFLNHLNDFNPKIPFMNLNPKLVQAFKLYLEETKGFTGSTMKVYFDKFKKVVHYAEKENYVDENQTRFLFDDAPIKVNKAKRMYLEIDEIRKLKSIQFTEEQTARERDRDLFLFQGCIPAHTIMILKSLRSRNW